jgi:hypothetical protein
MPTCRPGSGGVPRMPRRSRRRDRCSRARTGIRPGGAAVNRANGGYMSVLRHRPAAQQDGLRFSGPFTRSGLISRQSRRESTAYLSRHDSRGTPPRASRRTPTALRVRRQAPPSPRRSRPSATAPGPPPARPQRVPRRGWRVRSPGCARGPRGPPSAAPARPLLRRGERGMLSAYFAGRCAGSLVARPRGHKGVRLWAFWRGSSSG